MIAEEMLFHPSLVGGYSFGERNKEGAVDTPLKTWGSLVRLKMSIKFDPY